MAAAAAAAAASSDGLSPGGASTVTAVSPIVALGSPKASASASTSTVVKLPDGRCSFYVAAAGAEVASLIPNPSVAGFKRRRSVAIGSGISAPSSSASSSSSSSSSSSGVAGEAGSTRSRPTSDGAVLAPAVVSYEEAISVPDIGRRCGYNHLFIAVLHTDFPKIHAILRDKTPEQILNLLSVKDVYGMTVIGTASQFYHLYNSKTAPSIKSKFLSVYNHLMRAQLWANEQPAAEALMSLAVGSPFHKLSATRVAEGAAASLSRV